MLRRKGSKIVRLSVFEGTSLATDTLSKRKSDDGETLGCTLARMKDAKRKAPTPLIGELSFENDEPAKPPSQPRLPPPTQTIPAPPRQVALSKENLAAYAATAIGVSSKPPSEPALANLAYAASAYMTIPTSKASSNISLNGQAQYPFPMIPASLPPVPLVSIKGFPQPPSALPGFKQPSSNVSIPTGPMPASSVMSVSRANILGAQMRGAQMLGAAASTISVASNRSNASPKRGKSGQTPPRPSPGRKHSQPQSAKTAVSMPMSKVEDSFISMTPARSEMSIKSSKSTDPASWDSNVSQRQYGPGSLQNNVMPSSVPAPSQLPQDARATYKSKNTMRASTAPLPPLPDEYSNKPLPLRESNVSQIDNAHRSRTSAHRPIKRLTVDTEAAKEQARKQLLAKQIAAEQRQKTLALEEGKKATRASAVAQGGLPDFDTKALPLGNTATDAPKTSSSLTDKMASVFTPRRPNRKESASELPARVPRPPSAEPLDPALDQFGHGQHVRRDSTATDSSHGASSIMGKSKGMTRIFGFGRNRAKVG